MHASKIYTRRNKKFKNQPTMHRRNANKDSVERGFWKCDVMYRKFPTPHEAQASLKGVFCRDEWDGIGES